MEEQETLPGETSERNGLDRPETEDVEQGNEDVPKYEFDMDEINIADIDKNWHLGKKRESENGSQRSNTESDAMETDSMDVNYSINSAQIFDEDVSEAMETDVTLSEEPNSLVDEISNEMPLSNTDENEVAGERSDEIEAENGEEAKFSSPKVESENLEAISDDDIERDVAGDGTADDQMKEEELLEDDDDENSALVSEESKEEPESQKEVKTDVKANDDNENDVENEEVEQTSEKDGNSVDVPDANVDISQDEELQDVDNVEEPVGDMAEVQDSSVGIEESNLDQTAETESKDVEDTEKDEEHQETENKDERSQISDDVDLKETVPEESESEYKEDESKSSLDVLEAEDKPLAEEKVDDTEQDENNDFNIEGFSVSNLEEGEEKSQEPAVNIDDDLLKDDESEGKKDNSEDLSKVEENEENDDSEDLLKDETSEDLLKDEDSEKNKDDSEDLLKDETSEDLLQDEESEKNKDNSEDLLKDAETEEKKEKIGKENEEVDEEKLLGESEMETDTEKINEVDDDKDVEKSTVEDMDEKSEEMKKDETEMEIADTEKVKDDDKKDAEKISESTIEDVEEKTEEVKKDETAEEKKDVELGQENDNDVEMTNDKAAEEKDAEKDDKDRQKEDKDGDNDDKASQSEKGDENEDKKEENSEKLESEKSENGDGNKYETIDEDDVKLIDITASKDDKTESGVAVATDSKDQDASSATAGEDNEMCLQISSVSGSTDITDMWNKDEDTKKEEDGAKPMETTESKEAPDTKNIKIEPEKAVKKELVTPKSEIKQEPKPASTAKPASKAQTCIVCKKTGKCKYNIVRNGDIKHLCDDACFKQFRSNPTVYLRQNEEKATPVTAPKQAEVGVSPKNAAPILQPPQERYKTCIVCQLMDLKASKPFLSWQALDFCGEDCLGKFQGGLSQSCSYCGNQVQRNSKGKFCLRVGNDIKQFCSGTCHGEFKKRQKICEYCQRDLKICSDAFVAPVGKDGTFKDFCSQTCLQKYEDKTNRDVEIVAEVQKSQVLPKGNFKCSVCGKTAPAQHEIKLEGKFNQLCSDPCFSAFQYANKLTMNTCDNCGVYCYNEGMQPQYIQFEGQQKRFCSFMCVNTFKNRNKKTVSCAWCNSKKSNFDMIERVDANNKYQLFCSLNCLSLYRVNLQATSNQAVSCDQCRKFIPAQYHLTMSDASVRNFCSYNCVMTFQSQFTSGNKLQPPKTGAAPQPQPAPATQPPASKTIGTRQSTRVQQKQQTQAAVPVISNVVSLAPKGAPQVNRVTHTQAAVMPQQTAIRTAAPVQQKTISTQVVIQPPAPKQLKNKSLLCKPFVQTKATSCRPHTQTKDTQTDGEPEKKSILIPVPVPVYIPVPMGMYTQPTPVPLPIPIPIPVPCFIPTTKKNADSILKQIKEIREKIPSDPLEAELLMMAEAVAGGDNESESDTDNEPDEPVKDMDTTKPTVPASKTQEAGAESNEFGEDMLQMALRMASEMNSEPAMDLETSIEPVPVNTEPPPPPPQPRQTSEPEEEDEEYVPPRETRSKGRGTKRSAGRSSRSRSKKPKIEKPVERVEEVDESSSATIEQEPPPDANMYLKYTYGVNAWKHWVVHKNAQLEKVTKQGSGKLKLFKTDMLQCSADELNYSLCLFVKEVRKPNGDEYAPDSIYYLCLGIQQYLFESARIDNIFTDLYYEKFTECLNEVLLRYEPKINMSGQLVCRIEEEHLWECKQLGAHSPHVLLNTLVYFNTKYFMLKAAEDHMKLSFTHIMKHWKKTPIGKTNTTGRSVYLRYYCPAPTKTVADVGQKKKKEELPVYEQAENLDNPLRCPVKLYEFYLSKCPESIKNRNDAFYLVPERSCVPDSPVWYSTQNLQIEAMNKMLHRLRLVREIQEAMIHTQPVYAS